MKSSENDVESDSDLSAAIVPVPGIDEHAGNTVAEQKSSLGTPTGTAFRNISGSTAAAALAAGVLQPPVGALAAMGAQFTADFARNISGFTASGDELRLRHRLDALQAGLLVRSNTEADVFGRVSMAAAKHPGLSKAVQSAIAATQSRGAFGTDFGHLRQHAAEVSVALDDQETAADVGRPLRELQNLTHMSDELLLDLGEAFGWWEQIKTNRVSTAGLFFGFTVGLTRFVTSYGPGTPLPQSLFDAVLTGGTIYLALSQQPRK